MDQGEGFTIYCGNNRDFYSEVPQGVKLITDPPYGAEVHHKDKVGRTAAGLVDSVPVPFEQLTLSDIGKLAGFAEDKISGWAIIFCQTEQISEWRSIWEGRTLDKIRYFRPMLWIKPDAKPNLKGHGPGVGHETIMAYWCGEGKQRWNGGGKVGVFYHTRNRATDGGFKHPTEKPVPLMKELVRYFTDPCDTVFDPFMGCGSTGVAALELGRKFIGIEKNESYYAEAKRRLIEASRPGLILPKTDKMPTLFGDSQYGSSGTRRRLVREAKEKQDAS